MAEYSSIEKTIVASLSALSDHLRALPAAHGNWTKAVVECLTQAAPEHGCHGCAHSCGRGEFLYDVTWLKLLPDGHLQDVPLVAESEWGNGKAVETDFDKLLLTRAAHRLMVFDGTRIANCTEFIGQLRERVRQFGRTGKNDRYLFAFWLAFPDGRDRFKFEQFLA